MTREICLWTLLLVLTASARSSVNLALIIDHSSTLSASILVHSIIWKGATLNTDYNFYVIALEQGRNGTLAGMWEGYMSCYRKRTGLYFRTIVFEGLNPALKGVCEGEIHICARFYLPVLLEQYSVLRYVYLDNDAILTTDISQLWETDMIPLVDWEEKPHVAKEAQRRSDRSSRLRDKKRKGEFDPNTLKPKIMARFNHPYTRARPSSRQLAATPEEPIVSFVWENHPQYQVYIQSHFNWTNPIVKKRLMFRSDTLFFNAGVAVVQAEKWRKANITGWFERLLLSNTMSAEDKTWNIFNFEGSGDQGAFSLAPQSWLGVIPEARWNMRRLPKKTLNLITTGEKGIIHFAGMKGSNLGSLCLAAHEYPLLVTTGAINLLMDAVKSAKHTCTSLPPLPVSCMP